MVNVPNAITLLRVFSVPVFIMAIFYRSFKIALFIFLLASLTDALDGFVARKFGKVTKVGVILDPLADKAAIDSGYFFLSYVDRIVPPWITVIVLSRDALLLMGGLLLLIFGKIDKIKPTLLGKATAFFQFFTLLLVLVQVNFSLLVPGVIRLLFFMTAVFTVLSALHYSYIGIRELNGE